MITLFVFVRNPHIFFKLLILTTSVVFFALPVLILASEPTNTLQPSGAVFSSQYDLLSDVGGIDTIDTANGFYILLNTLYSLAIGLGAILAVLMLIYSGVRYMTVDAFTEKKELRDRIVGALGGLIFLIAAVAILNVINPKLSETKSVSVRGSSLNFGEEQFEVRSTDDANQTSTSTGQRDPFAKNDITADDFIFNNNNAAAWDNTIGDPLSIPSGSQVWVPNADPTSVNVSELSATEDECRRRNGGVGCVQVENPVSSPVTRGGGGADSGAGSNVPSISRDMLQMSPPSKGRRCDDQRDDSGYYCVPLRDEVAQRIGWPVNPYRRPVDFASKGNKRIQISRTAVEMDRYFNDQFKARFGKTLRLVSAYRDPAHNRNVGSTANNHQLGYSLDYGTRELNQAELNFLQDLIIQTNVVRVGWGRTNNAGTHVQWDDGHNRKWIYWCYQRGTGPHKGRGTMPSKWTKGGSCGW